MCAIKNPVESFSTIRSTKSPSELIGSKLAIGNIISVDVGKDGTYVVDEKCAT